MENCHRLFPIDNILQHVEIWRHVHASNVCLALHETVGDMDISDLVLEKEEGIIKEDLEEVRDDSSLYVMDDTLQSSFSNLET